MTNPEEPSRTVIETPGPSPASSPAGGAGRVEVYWPKVLWFYANLIPGLIALPLGLSLRTSALGFLLAFLTLCVGHSVGLHRGIIHRTYETSRLAKAVLVTLFAFAGLGGPVSWLRVHFTRDYWQNLPTCPRYFQYEHGIIQDFHWNIHCRFVPTSDAEYGIPDEDARDGLLLFFERTWFVWPTLLAIVIAITMGPAVAGITCCLRVAGGILGHWFVGFVSHKIGYVRYGVEGASAEGRNVFFLGVISFGEGFHNNHHAYPASARMGVKWYELDAGWWVVRSLEIARVFRQVNVWNRPGFKAKPTASAVAPHFIFRSRGEGEE